MTVLSKGHRYLLSAVDNGAPQMLVFVKRTGQGYPGNRGQHGGTQTQEVLRALIDRTLYVNHQIPHSANGKVVEHLRLALLALEERAAERNGLGTRLLAVAEPVDLLGGIEGKAIERSVTCPTCGHIVCHHEEQSI